MVITIIITSIGIVIFVNFIIKMAIITLIIIVITTTTTTIIIVTIMMIITTTVIIIIIKWKMIFCGAKQPPGFKQH